MDTAQISYSLQNQNQNLIKIQYQCYQYYDTEFSKLVNHSSTI